MDWTGFGPALTEAMKDTMDAAGIEVNVVVMRLEGNDNARRVRVAAARGDDATVVTKVMAAPDIPAAVAAFKPAILAALP